MHPFSFTKAANTRDALDAGQRGGRYIAGGTTLVDLMRETVERPDALVDITALPLREITVTKTGGLRLGALVSMSQAAAHPAVHPVISQALELSASAQLRNMATLGGNIMQRTRCTYFRDVTAACNKRSPGSGCAALGGYNRAHAILGGSEQCVATHPSDLAVACTALEVTVHLLGPTGSRTLPFTDFLLRPGTTPDREQALRPGELITAVEVPAYPRTLKSGYLKVRDRQSYEFALTSAAVALNVRGGVVREAKVAAGGVGTVPWKLSIVEHFLLGKQPSEQLWSDAAARAADGAQPLAHNGFKVELLKRTVERQLRGVGGAA
ncbi:carbon-monoxide dehydrogenase medium subunit [Amycolatopsis mediterranei S699]|uniref:Carbon-monoxide dehydrogenase medium subunit n=2 Tax=Amycolatopsis mediterranei TaxID=33910 RepID=A0A0H3DA32_AMYMU|nr:FAD binding domain-containing protein [Amycolatopsis mediterranei]ADJ47506.1 carbon-monoxide dehydrogenase medium subunit [Amycolatopsis mediterranei U32]AEK44362.1 carbon-monoxide dehydrogenase medium subunit [Amycolatopsis mediterranei S699]AFO79217.1 carbon-monoxide dehydrogenase medium subunit [Amycolatopsis mediterranei S699]AGT86345.1 carbon-monoxide dehydrogenase medium subunit [Amycolatopsis mediterranei RB]KDO12566.1 FAD-binding molybdopterin dehydrogenase [Amycolatopsis mediterran